MVHGLTSWLTIYYTNISQKSNTHKYKFSIIEVNLFCEYNNNNKKLTKYLKFKENLHALRLRSQIFRVLSWLPETTKPFSPRNLADITLLPCPVKVCFKNKYEN